MFDRKKRSERIGHGIIDIIINLGDGERKYIAFGSATPMEWRRIEKSKELADQVAKYEEILGAMKMMGEEMTKEAFDAHLGISQAIEVRKSSEKEKTAPKQQKKRKDNGFIEFVKEIQEQEDVAKATLKHKKVVLRSLEEFGGILSFDDLTPSNIMAYDRWLHNGVRTVVTCNQYHKYVRYYINLLMMEERISSNPYTKVTLRKGHSKERQPLTEEELIKVRDAVLEREKLDRVRDLFIFMAYTGLSYIDTQSFDFKKMTVFDKETGLYFIDGRRLKTKTKYFTPILPPAQKVLEKNNYQLLKISNQKANDHLHTIEEKLGIEHPMTCHIARHSFATLCLAHGVPADNVSKMLGHTNLKTTMRYAKTLQTTIRHNTSALVGSLL